VTAAVARPEPERVHALLEEVCPMVQRRWVSIALVALLTASGACSSGGPAGGGAGTPPAARTELLRRMPSGASLLFVSVSGIGSGQVTSPDVDLGFIQDAVFERSDVRGAYWAYVQTGTRVTLTATPATGSAFAGWFGTCAGTGSCTATLGDNVDVGVEFEPQRAAARASYSLEVHALTSYANLRPVLGATPSSVALSCVSGGRYVVACSATVPAGLQVTLTAAVDPAQPQFAFQGWGGACSGTGACVVTMDRDASVTAGFGTGATQVTSACAVANGSGTQTWSGTAYGPCTITACNAGFADCDGVAANGCEASLQTDAAHCGSCATTCSAVSNGTAACTAGSCGVASCNPGYTLASGGCIATTLPCTVANGAGTQTWSGSAYGACNATSCATGYHLHNNACEPDALVCVVANGVGVQSWLGTAYGSCQVASCAAGYADCNGVPADGCEVTLSSDAANCGACARSCPAVPNGTPACTGGTCGISGCDPGYALAGASCVPTTIACPVADGTGEQVWDSASRSYGACNVASCNAGYHVYGNACAPNVISCSVANGVGTQTWNGTAYAACVVSACSAGYGDCDGSFADGCEANVRTDVRNCGGCGIVCPSVPNGTATCTNGACGVACNAGSTLSGGVCVLQAVPGCRIVNGVRWCYDPSLPVGSSCNTLCGRLGLPVWSNDSAWIAAQSTTAGCQAIASAFGMQVAGVGSYAYACAEYSSALWCSTSPSCAAAHRTTSDTSFAPVCPCQ
jgi:hypothetical protein